MKIKVFVRHCNFSSNSVGKNRPEWFSREKCWDNLKLTSDKDTEIIVMFDGKPNEEHFLSKDKEGYNLVCKYGGTDGHSFPSLTPSVTHQTAGAGVIDYNYGFNGSNENTTYPSRCSKSVTYPILAEYECPLYLITEFLSYSSKQTVSPDLKLRSFFRISKVLAPLKTSIKYSCFIFNL